MPVEADAGEGARDLRQRPLQHPRRIGVVHVVFDRAQIGQVDPRPDVRRLLRAAAARCRIEDLRWRSVVGEDAPGGGVGGATRVRGRGTRHLAVRRVAQVEAVATMAAGVEDGERADGDRKRLHRRISSARLGFAGEHTRNVDLERDRGDATARCRRTEDDRAAGARLFEIGVADVGCRRPRQRERADEQQRAARDAAAYSRRWHPGRQRHWMIFSPSV
jgi:hypothetical protein